MDNKIFQSYKLNGWYGGNHSKESGYDYKTDENVILAYSKSAVKFSTEPIKGMIHIF